METAYDWITVMIFAGLVTHFLSQSVKPDGSDDSLCHYMVPSVGCGIANWLGNEGYWPAAILMIGAVLWYIYRFLGPGRHSPPQH